MSKKKICFVAQFPPPIHGLSKAVETLYNSALNSEANPNGEFEFEKVDITNNKVFLKNLVKISKSKADLFYFTISQTKGGNLRDLVIFKLLELQHKKCLIHLHGGYYRQLVDNDMADWQRKANYRAINKLEGIIVLSQSLRNSFDGMIEKEKVYVVDNCIDREYMASDKSMELKLELLKTKKVLHVLWLSNFIQSKGYLIVIELAKLEKKRIDAGEEQRFVFDFAGAFFDDDEKINFIENIKRNRLEKICVYHGVAEGFQKRRLLEESDIFILPTRYPKEGQPISILEALGNGLYVITTDHAGIPDIIEDRVNGMVLKKNFELPNIYQKMLELCNQDYYGVAVNNRRYCVKRFVQERYIEGMKRCFETASKGRN